jgi:hypothetical protein
VKLAVLVSTIAFGAGCWGAASSPASTPALPHPRFAPPTTIADCKPDRLAVEEVPFEVGLNARRYNDHVIEWFLPSHAHKIGDTIVLLVPTPDLHEKVLALEARPFDARTGRWLPAVSFQLAQRPGLAPASQEIETGVVRGGVIVAWTDIAHRAFAKRFSLATGVWEDADPNIQLAGPNHLLKHPAYPPKPDATTRVTLEVSGQQRLARFLRGGSAFGTLTFAARPGTYIGAFANTRTGLLWNNLSVVQQSQTSAAERYESYLVHLETGQTCHVTRELAYPGTAVFRMTSAIILLNLHHTAPEQSHCPAGAPCMAPEPGRFNRVSLTIFRDGG